MVKTDGGDTNTVATLVRPLNKYTEDLSRCQTKTKQKLASRCLDSVNLTRFLLLCKI